MIETCEREARCCGGQYTLPRDDGVWHCGMCAKLLAWRCTVHHGLWPSGIDYCPWRSGTITKDGTEARVITIPKCDLCCGRDAGAVAAYDAKTRGGPWAYLCAAHFDQYGIGLGIGRGQRLIRVKG